MTASENYLTEADFEDPADTDTSESSPSPSAIENSAPPVLDLPPIPDLPGPLADAPPMDLPVDARAIVDQPQTSRVEVPFELSQDELDRFAADRQRFAAAAPKGAATAISIFGDTKMTGRKFIFVLDRSQSMGNQGLGVIRAARNELTRAVSELQDNHEFQIVAYHDRTVMIGKRELLPATEENKNRVGPFIDQLVAIGSTQHKYGIMAALSCKPDAIVLLTDGGYPGLSTSDLKTIRQQARGIEIHSIEFGSGPSQKSINFMTKLAKENGGTYRYVDVNHWRRED